MLALALPMTVLFLVAEVIAHILDRRKAKRAALPATTWWWPAASRTTAPARARESDDPTDSTGSTGQRRERPARRLVRPMNRRVALVVNPAAGKGRARELLPEVAGTLRDAGHELEILLSRDFSRGRGDGRAAAARGVDVLAVMGGDGMMHLGLNAVRPGPAVRRHQADAGPDSRRHRERPVPRARARPGRPGGRGGPDRAGEHPVRADRLQVGDRFVGAVLATGFDALVNAPGQRDAPAAGVAALPAGDPGRAGHLPPLAYRLVLDGQVRELEAMLVAIGNTTSYGGGMRICPQADPFDGWLDLTIIHPVGRLTLLQLLPQMYSGSFARDRLRRAAARPRRCGSRAPAWSATGTGSGSVATPLDVMVLPDALPVFVPGPG